MWSSRLPRVDAPAPSPDGHPHLTLVSTVHHPGSVVSWRGEVQDACVDVEDVSADSAAIERLYREEGPRLWRALLGYTGDAETAGDTVMEAFAQRKPGRS